MGVIEFARLGLRSAWRSLLALRCAVIATFLTTTSTMQARAEEAEAAAGAGGKSWAIPWLVVVLAVALGLFISLRPAGRATEIKRDGRTEL